MTDKENKNWTKNEIKGFRQFAFKGRILEMSVAFMVGAAFQQSVQSLTSNILMPFINYFIVQTGSDWRSLTWTPVAGMKFFTGKFLGSFVDFFLISVILYIIYIKIIKQVFEIDESDTKECPNCFNKIPILAKRCPLCTSWTGELNESE